MDKKNVAVLSGGYSKEKEISLKSVELILDTIDRDRYNVYHIRIDEKGWNLLHDEMVAAVNRADFSVISDGHTVHFDFVYIMIHGTPGEDGKLQGYFDLLSIPYSTPNQLNTALTFNKWACNNLLRDLGYKVAKSFRYFSGDDVDVRQISKQVGLPCFVKPNEGGSSFGTHKVYEENKLTEAIQDAAQHSNEVIIESFIEGIEVTNGVVGVDGKIIVLPITEIVSDNDFFDYEAKYKGNSNEITPARLSDELTSEIKRLSHGIYKELSLKGIVRVDYLIKEEKPYVLEINTVPGMSPESIIPQQLRAEGIDLSDLISLIIEDNLNQLSK